MRCFAVLLVCLFVSGCGFKEEKKQTYVTETPDNSIEYQRDYNGETRLIYKVVTIRGHEYIASFSAFRNWIVGPHCADCKFCKEKSK